MSTDKQPKVAKEPDVLAEMTKLDNSITDLNNDVAGLGDQLKYVQRSEPAGDGGDAEKTPSLTCEMAQSLMVFRHRIENIRKFINGQRSLLEI